MYTPERAKQRVSFIEQYRSYVINYNLGKDMARRYIESRGGTAANPSRRWSEFEKLLLFAAAALGTAVIAAPVRDFPRSTPASVSVVVNLPWRSGRARRLRRRCVPLPDHWVGCRQLVLPVRSTGNARTRGRLAAL